jgi:hypothetical protein
MPVSKANRHVQSKDPYRGSRSNYCLKEFSLFRRMDKLRAFRKGGYHGRWVSGFWLNAARLLKPQGGLVTN